MMNWKFDDIGLSLTGIWTLYRLGMILKFFLKNENFVTFI